MFKRTEEQSQQRAPLTGQRLRSYAFALLTRRDYSKAELNEKLTRYAQNPEEVKQLVEELSEQNYQSDQRVAEQMLASQIRKGRGPKRIQQALKTKQLENDLIADEIHDIDWVEQAYELKVKKFGEEVEKDPKLKAKQIRFLQYRGFDLDVIIKAVQRRVD